MYAQQAAGRLSFWSSKHSQVERRPVQVVTAVRAIRKKGYKQNSMHTKQQLNTKLNRKSQMWCENDLKKW